MMSTLRLPVVLTEEERLSKGKRAGELSYDLFQIEEQAKEAKAAVKAQMHRLQGEIADLHGQLRTGREYREVEVSIEKDLKQRLEITTRLDTGEVVSTRPLATDEMQGELKLAEKEKEPSSEQIEEKQLPSEDDWIKDSQPVDQEDDEQFGDDELGEQVDEDDEEEYDGPPSDAPEAEKIEYLRKRVQAARKKSKNG